MQKIVTVAPGESSPLTAIAIPSSSRASPRATCPR